MQKKVLILILFMVVLSAGCQLSRTRKQSIFDPKISNETRNCQNTKCHPSEKVDYYSPFKFSHNKHFAQTDAKNCDACHKERKHTKGPVELNLKFTACRQCHGEKSPHGKWAGAKGAKITHGKQANADIKSCLRCHKAIFCRVCHQVEVPHPKKWLKTHGPVTVLKGTSKCIDCHGNKQTKQMDFCFTCHAVPMPHPKDIKKTHGRLAKQVGVKKCFQCHDEQSFCTACHKTPMPHEKSFIDNHYKEIKSLTPSSCVQCHSNQESSVGGCFGGDCHTQK